MAPAIRLRRAVALLGRFPALAGIDLTVEGGEIVHLVGPNGAGKTTALRVCAGLVRVVAGQAEVLGHDLTADRRAVRRHVGLLGHASQLYEDLTVEESVRFAVRAAGGGRGDAEEALTRLGLDGRPRRLPVDRLSAGQRRRTALAVVLARRPSLWLLDEPHAGLDAEGRDLVDALVAEAAGAGATVVFASHDLDRAGAIAGRQVTITGGHAEPPDEPAAAPAAEPAAGPAAGAGVAHAP